MQFIIDLWKPILLAAVLVHIASALIWMVLPIHKHDYKDPGAAEGNILSFLRSAALAPGVYVVPWCTHQSMKDPAVVAKYKSGPWAQLIVQGGPMNIGKSMIFWITNLIIVSIFIAYVASNSLPAGTHYLKVFRVVGATALLAYAGNCATLSIWMGMPWKQLPGRIIDGLIYALLTAGAFGWLWPKAAAVAS